MPLCSNLRDVRYFFYKIFLVFSFFHGELGPQTSPFRIAIPSVLQKDDHYLDGTVVNITKMLFRTSPAAGGANWKRRSMATARSRPCVSFENLISLIKVLACSVHLVLSHAPLPSPVSRTRTVAAAYLPPESPVSLG